MHPSAMNNCRTFFEVYGAQYKNKTDVKVVDLGSQDVNGSLKDVCPSGFNYIGVDFEKAKGVDVILKNPYKLPFEDNSIDILISSSCFEHSEMFWLVYLEILRVLKPSGLFYLNVPSSGSFHRYPVDCWRFYPDSGNALVTWAKYNKYNPALLESYTHVGNSWQDFVAVFVKDAKLAKNYSDRIIHTKPDFENAHELSSGNDLIRANFRNQNSQNLKSEKRKVRALTIMLSAVVVAAAVSHLIW